MNPRPPPRRPPYRSGPWPHPDPEPVKPRSRIARPAAGIAGAVAGVALLLIACGRDALAIIPVLLAIVGGAFTPSREERKRDKP